MRSGYRQAYRAFSYLAIDVAKATPLLVDELDSWVSGPVFYKRNQAENAMRNKAIASIPPWSPY